MGSPCGDVRAALGRRRERALRPAMHIGDVRAHGRPGAPVVHLPFGYQTVELGGRWRLTTVLLLDEPVAG